jgi:hypothetical protein
MSFTLWISVDPFWSSDTTTLRLSHPLATKPAFNREGSAKLSYQGLCQK